jgi:hypothetical protein
MDHKNANDPAASVEKFPTRWNREFFMPNRDPNSSNSEIWSTDQGRGCLALALARAGINNQLRKLAAIEHVLA